MKVITIGRSSRNDLTISDPKVSRHHCQIVQHDDGSFTLADFGSLNGTYVNGQRIYGEVRLNPKDIIRIGNTIPHWRQYFIQGTVNPPPPQPPRKSKALPIVLGVIGGVMTLAFISVLAAFLYQKYSKPEHEFQVDGVAFDFNMTLKQLKEENTNATVVKYVVPSTKDDEDAVVFIKGYDYYIINNSITVTVDEQTQNINYFCTKSNTYSTPKGIRCGSTWGDMEKTYSNLTFCFTYYYYNYFAQCYEEAIEVWDSETCTHFAFFRRQFSSDQWAGITSVIGGTDFETYFEVSAISASIMQSIRSSVTIAQISVYDCNNSTYSNKNNKNNNNNNSKTNNNTTNLSAEQAARSLAIAMSTGDVSTIRNLTSNEMYEEIMENFDLDMLILDEETKERASKAYKVLPAETIKTGDNKVVIRFRRESSYLDFYMRKENGRWVMYDYAQNGVHISKSIRKQMRKKRNYQL